MQQTGGGHHRSGDVEMASTSTACRRGQPLPMPKPKTPPRHPDIHGKYRKQAELNHLDQEISSLEEELRSLEGLSPASRCCKEVAEYVDAHPDPLLPLDGEVQSSFRCLKIFDGTGQSILSCCCCSKECSVQQDACAWRLSCNFFRSWRCSCLKLPCKSCCKLPSLPCSKCSCIDCSCFRCVKCCHPCRRK